MPSRRKGALIATLAEPRSKMMTPCPTSTTTRLAISGPYGTSGALTIPPVTTAGDAEKIARPSTNTLTAAGAITGVHA